MPSHNHFQFDDLPHKLLLFRLKFRQFKHFAYCDIEYLGLDNAELGCFFFNRFLNWVKGRFFFELQLGSQISHWTTTNYFLDIWLSPKKKKIPLRNSKFWDMKMRVSEIGIFYGPYKYSSFFFSGGLLPKRTFVTSGTDRLT